MLNLRIQNEIEKFQIQFVEIEHCKQFMRRNLTIQ